MALGYVEGVTHDYERHGTVPRTLDIHLVIDNYATHKHSTVKRWLAIHERWHVGQMIAAGMQNDAMACLKFPQL